MSWEWVQAIIIWVMAIMLIVSAWNLRKSLRLIKELTNALHSASVQLAEANDIIKRQHEEIAMLHGMLKRGDSDNVIYAGVIGKSAHLQDLSHEDRTVLREALADMLQQLRKGDN